MTNNKINSYDKSSTIIKIIENYTGKPQKRINIKKLKGGYKNFVYLIETESDKYVLKITPKNKTSLLTIEKNTLIWEKEILIKFESIDIPSPKLLYFDDSCSICESPYILMSYLNGEVYSIVKNKLSLADRSNIEYKLGKICKKICSIKSEKYYIPGINQSYYNDNFEAVFYLYNTLMLDAKAINLKIDKFDDAQFKLLLLYFKNDLNDIDSICYTPTDLWDGNILVMDGEISGVIDFGEVYLIDKLMTFYFHDIHDIQSDAFIKGFGFESFNDSELVRIIIYKIITLLKMIIEKNYKNHIELSSCMWINKKIEREINKLLIIKNNRERRGTNE